MKQVIMTFLCAAAIVMLPQCEGCKKRPTEVVEVKVEQPATTHHEPTTTVETHVAPLENEPAIK